MAADQPRTTDAGSLGGRTRGQSVGRHHRQPVGENDGKWRPAGVRCSQEGDRPQRHILIDTGGLPVTAIVHSADNQDRDGAPSVPASNRKTCPWLRHVFADGVYSGKELNDALQHLGHWTLKIVRRSDVVKGFEVLPRRWVVEGTFAWLSRNRRLAKDFESSVTSAEA